MPLYEVHYRVTRELDSHPAGSRIRVVEAGNHLLACHEIRMSFDTEGARDVTVDGVRLAGRDMTRDGFPNHPWLSQRPRAA